MAGYRAKRCPTCRQPLPGTTEKPNRVRVCTRCHKPMSRHDKFTFEPDGRLKHRHCDNPGGYMSAADQEKADRAQEKERRLKKW